MAWKNAKGGFVYWLNRFMNPDHPWTDYYDPTTGDTVPKEGAGSLRGDSASYGAGSLSGSSILGTLGKGVEALINKWTDANMTTGEIQRNEMQMQNQEDIYQRQVVGMQKAGLNPALMYGSGAQSAPSVSTQGSGSASMSDLMQLMMMPLQKRLLQSQAQLARDQGKAALMNAGANVRNAGTNEAGLGLKEKEIAVNHMRVNVEQYKAETDRMRYDLEKKRADKQLEVSDAEIGRLAEQAALLKLQREQLPRQLEVALKNADSQAKQAIAALRQAEASTQNAATNDRLADYETSLKYAEEMLKWAEKEGRDVVNKYLDSRQKAELDNIIKEGVKLDKQGRLIDKQGNYLTSQMVRNYVNCATDLSGAVNQWLNPLSKGASGSFNGPNVDLSGAYQQMAYGYD